MPAPEPPPRRAFLIRLIQAMGALITAALALPAAAYLLGPTRRSSSSPWVEAANLTQLPLRAPEEVVFRRTRIDGWKIVSEKASAWLVRLDEHNVVAYSPQCTHLGCAYSYSPAIQEFVCPCHTSNFSLEGKVLMGPAPRPLDRFQVRLEGDKVLLGPLQPPENA